MLSTFPPTLSDSFIGNPFPPFEGGFSLPEYHEPFLLFEQEDPLVLSPQPSQEPVSSNSGSDTSNPAPVTPSSGSDEPNRNSSKLDSGSDKPNRNNSRTLSTIMDERKRRRMMSNRESARRSRMRKQNHLENLRSQLNRLKVGNRDLMNRVRLMSHQNQLVHTENECLRSEATMLRQRLWDIRQVLLVRQLQQHLNPSAWPCINNVASINQGQLPLHSLIN